LIDAKKFYKFTKSKLGEKSKEVSDEYIAQILKIYQDFSENQNSKIYKNDYFKYTKITIDQYLKDVSGDIIKDKKGNPKIDKQNRKYEKVPFNQKIEKYLLEEVKPHINEYFYNKDLNKIGYEISLTKEFYDYIELRPIEEIKKDLKKLNEEISSLEKDL